MDRRTFLLAAGAAAGAAVLAADSPAEPLYNGIRLPSPWPPRITEVPRDPVTPPYLKNPLAVIPIDVGRQLFVDDFLIEATTLERTFHLPREHPDNPLVRPDRPWERKNGKGGMAMVFSDGVVAGLTRADCVAVRADKTRQALMWKSSDLARVAGPAVKFRFHLKDGRLYAFWVSPEKGGASHGYVAAGGPGFGGPVDSAG